MARPIGERPGTICLECGAWFYFKRYGIGHKWHYNRKQRLCSKKCADLFQCNEGWGTDKNGYQVQYRSNGNGKRVFQFEHRVVMERHLGRNLFPHETVHHKDGDRSNNSLSNLELWSSRHGRGQRVEDKIEFCLSFLQEYPEFLEGLGYRLVPVTQEDTAQPRVYESVNVLLM